MSLGHCGSGDCSPPQKAGRADLTACVLGVAAASSLGAHSMAQPVQSILAITLNGMTFNSNQEFISHIIEHVLP